MPRPSVVTPYTLGGFGTNTAVAQINGPLEHFCYVGSIYGSDLEFSFDAAEWVRMRPGDKLDGLNGAATMWVRNPNTYTTVFHLRHGSARFTEREFGVGGFDGKRPLTRLYATGGDLIPWAVFPFPMRQVDPREGIPAIKDLVACNVSAADCFLKLYQRINLAAGVPTVGVTGPLMTWKVPKEGGNLILTTTHGLSSRVEALPCYQLYLAATTGYADTDVGVPAAGDVKVLVNLAV